MAERFPRSLIVPALVLCCIAFMSACRSTPSAEAPVSSPPDFETPTQKAEPVDETTGFMEPETTSETIQESPSSLADRLNAQGIVQTVHFDFDKYDLRDDARRILARNAARLKEYSQLKIRIEGHCDERGTVEYNLALGEKRARAVRDFLIAQGIPASRFSIISFGKERPAEPGHNESAWAMNRRAEFLFRAN
jgi:peptidoglycan-associated lipoprotein